MNSIYPYLVALHVCAVVFFVGSLYAHHQITSAISNTSINTQNVVVLNALHKLHQRVTTPAMILTWLLGMTLATSASWFPARWLIIKLLLVLFLSAVHGFQSGRLRHSISKNEPYQPLRYSGVAVIISTLAIAILAFTKP